MALLRKSLLRTSSVPVRGSFEALGWFKNLYNTKAPGVPDTAHDTNQGRLNSIRELKDYEEYAANEDRNIADVPKDVPAINFTYYANRVPDEFGGEVKLAAAKWESPEKASALETLLTPAGENPKRNFHGLTAREQIDAINEKYSQVSAYQKFVKLSLELSKLQTEIWSKRSKTFKEYAALRESQRTTMETTAEDYMDYHPWIRKEIQEELDAGDWYADYDLKVPKFSEPISDVWLSRVDPKYQEHEKENQQVLELQKKLEQVEKAVMDEWQDSWRLKGTLTKPPTYAKYKYFTA